MSHPVWISAASLIGLTLFQCCLVWAYLRALRRVNRGLLSDPEIPKAAVILSVRGIDPHLEACLRGILQQDYPNYHLHVVVDSEKDPALPVLKQVLTDYPAGLATIDFLQERSSTCSLKCSALVQAIRTLDESFEMIALIDADTIPHPSWLRELATALSNPNVGAATGNRWFRPKQPTLGSLGHCLGWYAGIEEECPGKMQPAGQMGTRFL